MSSEPNYHLTDYYPAFYLRRLKLNKLEGEDHYIPGETSLGRFYYPRLMTFLHEVFSTGEHCGDTLMEMCCGPTIHTVMSASKYYDNIYMTEFAAANRRAVEMWRSADPSFEYDWTPYFEFVGQREGSSPKEVEERLRRRMRGVYPCDLTEERPLGDFSPPPLDCLISVLTITAAAQTPAQYRVIMKKMADHIKPGGLLVLVGTLRSDYYVLNGDMVRDMNVEEDFVRGCLGEVGLEVGQYTHYPVPPSEAGNSGRYYYFLTAKKN